MQVLILIAVIYVIILLRRIRRLLLQFIQEREK